MRPTFSSLDLVRLTDLSYRQVDYWCRLGVLQPMGDATPGSGTQRRFAETELVIAAVCSQLSELGAEVHSVCEHVATQIRAAAWRPESIAGGRLYIGSDGEVATEPCAPGWVIDLDAILEPA